MKIKLVSPESVRAAVESLNIALATSTTEGMERAKHWIECAILELTDETIQGG